MSARANAPLRGEPEATGKARPGLALHGYGEDVWDLEGCLPAPPPGPGQVGCDSVASAASVGLGRPPSWRTRLVSEQGSQLPIH